MGSIVLDGVQLTPLRVIPGDLGDVYHGLKKQESSFSGFGEAYFSSVNHLAVKGWKLHTQMVSNLIVPVGAIRFVLYDDRADSPTKGQFMDITLSKENYQRLTIPPFIWMGFQGRSTGLNLLLNVASISHDPTEAEQLPLDTEQIPFQQW